MHPKERTGTRQHSRLARCTAAALCLGLGVPQPSHAAPAESQGGERYSCAAVPAKLPASAKPFPVVATNGDHVFLNGRAAHEAEFWFLPPQGKVFLLTDMVVQNRASGDTPVQQNQFSRVAVTIPTGQDAFFIVGNRTLSEHFDTAWVLPSAFRFYNLSNSTVPFVEVFITGVLRDCTRTAAHTPAK